MVTNSSEFSSSKLGGSQNLYHVIYVRYKVIFKIIVTNSAKFSSSKLCRSQNLYHVIYVRYK